MHLKKTDSVVPVSEIYRVCLLRCILMRLTDATPQRRNKRKNVHIHLNLLNVLDSLFAFMVNIDPGLERETSQPNLFSNENIDKFV